MVAKFANERDDESGLKGRVREDEYINAYAKGNLGDAAIDKQDQELLNACH